MVAHSIAHSVYLEKLYRNFGDFFFLLQVWVMNEVIHHLPYMQVLHLSCRFHFFPILCSKIDQAHCIFHGGECLNVI